MLAPHSTRRARWLRDRGGRVWRAGIALVARDRYHQLRSPPADFTGRAAELAGFRTELGPGSTIVALTGQEGVAETLVLVLAHEIRNRYPARRSTST